MHLCQYILFYFIFLWACVYCPICPASGFGFALIFDGGSSKMYVDVTAKLLSQQDSYSISHLLGTVTTQ